jgi:diguanylate cyclase (GGDEF)-like protein/PAS domain S-box-containing protein
MLATDITEPVCQLSVLFVEDDADVRESMMRFLSRRIKRVYTASDGEAGLGLFNEHHPDLVISDIRMDGMDGLEMCCAIRQTTPDMPVIIISAHNEADVLLSSIDMGVTKFIVKPVDTDVLMQTIAHVAESIGQRRNLQGRLQQVDAILNEADYETSRVRRYVSRFLEANHHDELANIRHLNIPKLGVSGDFYCVAKNREELYVMLADGAGHGVSAVLPALQIPGLFQQQAMRGFSLLAIAARINNSLHEQHLTEHFVATTLVRINASAGFIEVVNCANPPALIYTEDGVLLHECHSRSTALGMVSDAEFSAEVERFTMNQNARIYLFTDGLVDTLHATEPGFGDDSLHALFACNFLQGGFDHLVDRLSEAASRSRVDDVTLLEIAFDCAEPVVTALPLAVPMTMDAEAPVDMRQTTLLYVEDDETTREYLAHYLSRRMGMVYVAQDGEEGLSLFRAYRPQIVLSDIRMPKMDGLAMAKAIRQQDKDVPIVLISGSDNAEDAECMLEMGVSRFYMKPLDPGRLNNTIQACIRQVNALNRLRLSASALDASSLAVITADRDKRIVSINPAFACSSGYLLSDVQGLNPVMLSSGKYDAERCRTMWQELDKTGNWSGELQCRHKNGATISEWLTVNAVKGDGGEVTGYHFIFSDSSEREMNEARFRQLSSHDSLTRLPNRMMFSDRVNALLAEAKPLALVCINIDHFTGINTMLGVSVGDRVLHAVAQRVLACAGDADRVCRLGGDEFAVLMPDAYKQESIDEAVERLLRAVSQQIEIDGQVVQLQASLGISLYPADGDTCDALIKSAYSAMNQAQLAGGNTSRFFEQSVNQREMRQAALRQGIRTGLQKNEFYMLYQPKYSLSQHRVVGAEALVRWGHPQMGVISPVEFIPLAEESGAIIDMSLWIIDTVCEQLAVWRSRKLPQVPVSINISPVHFRRGDLASALRAGVQKWDIPAEMLPIEVTEGVVMDAAERTMQLLGELKAMGFKLSIDDFGTGYSSLKYLKDLPVSELKIDRSFIIDIPGMNEPEDLSRTAIPRAIIQLAAEFNLGVVAEGVEEEHQKNFLIANGCDVIQGYLFSRPVTADEFASLMIPGQTGKINEGRV